MLKGLSLRFKLILAFLVIVVFLTGVSVYQIRSIQHLNTVFAELVDTFFARVDALNQVKLIGTQIHDQTVQYQYGTLAGAALDHTAYDAELKKSAVQLKSEEAHYRSLVVLNDANAQAVMEAVDEVVTQSQAVGDAAAGRATVPDKLERSFNQAQAGLKTAVDQALAVEGKHVNQADTEVGGTVIKFREAIIILTGSAVVLALLLGVVVSSWIARSLSHIKVGAQRIASGDFSQPIAVKSRDEIGAVSTAFNQMAERLKEAYRRQAYAQQRDEAMLQSMGEGLIAVDGEGRITLINDVASRLLELPKGTPVIGKLVQDVYQLYGPEPTAEQPLPTERRPSFISLKNGVGVNDVFGFHASGNRKLLINITASPIKNGEQVTGAITVLRDVTKEREVDRMKTEFISLASHQLRTPLSAIKWFSEMLASGDAGELQPEQLDFANNIASSTERMIDLVNALLNISRIESGRIMVDPKPTDIKKLVSDIVNDLKAKLEEKQQNLVISVHDDLPQINLDPRLIGQVYLNLLTNAIKYTPKGGEIAVFVSRKEDQIVSQVTDNGYGIPKDQQARVFQKFFRAANAVKVETDGTGLGLYLIKAIIESSGGKIWFSSEEGKGTTFWFSMPMSGMKAKQGEVTLDV